MQGLEHIGKNTILDGLLGVFKIVVAADNNEFTVDSRFTGKSDNVQSRQAGHADISYNQVRPALEKQLISLAGIIAGHQVRNTQFFPGERIDDSLKCPGFIVDYQCR